MYQVMASSEHASSDLAVHVWHQLAEDGKPTVYREHEGGGTKETTVGVRDVEEAGDLDAVLCRADSPPSSSPAVPPLRVPNPPGIDALPYPPHDLTPELLEGPVCGRDIRRR
eukprot:CAMPEP_0118632054 /NCGR_PEP_ID=MMETSP0785-20121206/234_1 /TAXON_ID=91992 /ORGANISM="Bolidomonas pacifica, Strain CCMP 1866" /LENGTH=111 /DNA_ID=CAMNT_0006522787 /DNA_START=137 /DNA_END=472 /DNA_ORIENTATION=+